MAKNGGKSNGKNKSLNIPELRSSAQKALSNGRWSADLVPVIENWLERTPESRVLPYLTTRQFEIFQFLQKGAKRQKPPTVREIGTEFGIKSPNGVMCHLKALQKKGLIIRDERQSRGIQIPDYYIDSVEMEPQREKAMV
jgi:hypothetical protein